MTAKHAIAMTLLTIVLIIIALLLVRQHSAGAITLPGHDNASAYAPAGSLQPERPVGNTR